MSKKRNESTPQRHVSKRQLSKWQRQKRIRNIILAIGLVTIAAVLVIVGLGLYNNEVKPFARKAIRVNDTTFNMRYYINSMVLYRAVLIGSGASSAQVDGVLADYTENQIKQRELARQAAAKLGVTVDRKQIADDLKESGGDTSRERVDFIETGRLVEKLRDEYFKSQVAEKQPHVLAMAMLLESEQVANDTKAKLAAGEDFGALAESLSKDFTTQSNKGDLGWAPASVIELELQSPKLAETLSRAETGVVTGPVFDDAVQKNGGWWILRPKEKTGKSGSTENPLKLHLEGILVGSEFDAKKIKERLAAGEDFATLAKELSQEEFSKESGGDLGSVTEEQATGQFGEGVAKLEVGAVSDPVSDPNVVTKGGYWLALVKEKDENRSISEEHVNTLVSDALTEWLEGLEEDSSNKVESFLDAETKSFALKEVRGF